MPCSLAALFYLGCEEFHESAPVLSATARSADRREWSAGGRPMVRNHTLRLENFQFPLIPCGVCIYTAQGIKEMV